MVPRPHSFFFVFLIVLLNPPNLVAEWRITTRRDHPSSDGGIWAFAISLTNGSNDAQVIGVQFSASQYEFRVVPNLDGIYSSVREVVEQRKAVAGVNGGYFKPNFVPVGLRVSRGETSHPLEHSKLLSGALVVRNGSPELRRIAEFAGTRGVQEAIQSGPFLVETSRPVSGLNNTREAARSFVFTTANADWGIGICRSVTLGQLAQILVAPDLLPHARITRALNLDGGSSTSFYLKMGQTELSSPGWVTVSDYLTVTTK
jgi:exopolysaccharide biosynthesis protein